MSGENPGQSIAMVGRVGKLFGVQLNDGYTRLAAEDGLMFGSVHPTMALEIMYQLRKISFEGHVYFDTFPQRTDPVKEAEFNIRKVKGFWAASGAIDKKRLQQVMEEHDAIGALEIADEAFRQL
jgi:L-rhamnose isomerase